MNLFICTRGGMLEAILINQRDHPPITAYVCDWDEYECDGKRDGQTEEEFEREHLAGYTWLEIEREAEVAY